MCDSLCSTVYGKTADTWEGPIPETAPLQVSSTQNFAFLNRFNEVFSPLHPTVSARLPKKCWGSNTGTLTAYTWSLAGWRQPLAQRTLLITCVPLLMNGFRFFQQVAPGGPDSLAIQDFAKQVTLEFYTD